MRPEAPRAPIVCSEEDCSVRWHGSDLAVATNVLRDLLRDTGPEAQLLLIVTDAEGVMLWLDGSGEALAAGAEAGAHPGALWSEAAVGTNAMGTALAEGHAVQIFASEHLSEVGDPWVCSAAPVRDPDTGARLGIVNLSGPMSTAHPHTLALAGAAARTVEERLRSLAAARDHRLRERWAARVGPGRALALASSTGTVLLSTCGELSGLRVQIPGAGATVRVGPRTAMAEPVPGGFLLWGETATPKRRVPVPRLEFLGRDHARMHVLGERPVDLSRRHSEILVLLITQPRGLTDEQLAFELYGDGGKPVTARAEISRLRNAIGPCITHAPYRLTDPISADFADVERLAEEGRLGLVLARYPGPLLPRSEVPIVSEVRERLDYLVRDRVLGTSDPKLLARWMETPTGQDDVQACRALANLLAASDTRRPAVLSRLRRLTGAYGSG